MFRKRPQHPKSRPYTIEQHTIDGGAPGISIAGELTAPPGDGPSPGIVLVAGSGPIGRDEHVAGHKWFLVLSDFLTRNGYAVFRFDKRGVGKTAGKFRDATVEDFADDAAAAMRWFKNHDRVDEHAVGYLGHSEGGIAAPLAAKIEPAHFMITLAGPALPLLPDVVARQYSDLLRSEGKPEERAQRAFDQVHGMTAVMRECETVAEARKRMCTFLKSEGIGFIMRWMLVRAWATNWGLAYTKNGYSNVIAEFDGPVLAIFGGSDLQVAADENHPAAEAMLQHPDSDVMTFAGMNHLFQYSPTGALAEYAKIETTIDERVLQAMLDWLQTKVLKRESVQAEAG